MDRQLNGMLTDEAYRGWHGFARDYGVTVSALLEALGHHLAKYDPPARLPDLLRSSVEDARRIAAERGRRS